jgi:hypothetical protein
MKESRREVTRGLCRSGQLANGVTTVLNLRGPYVNEPAVTIPRAPAVPNHLIPALAPRGGSLAPLVLVGDFPPVLYGLIAFGDTDHDMKIEGAGQINLAYSALRAPGAGVGQW